MRDALLTIFFLFLFIVLVIIPFNSLKYKYNDLRHKHTKLEEKYIVCKKQLDICEEVVLQKPIKHERFVVTAYVKEDGGVWNDGRSAKLFPVGYGMVAADWRVFPPGTVLFIPGYGYGIVLDKGAAIKGKRIDVFVKSKKEAIKWGKKKLTVWVIGKLKVSFKLGKSIQVKLTSVGGK